MSFANSAKTTCRPVAMTFAGIIPRQKSVESISLSARASYPDAYARPTTYCTARCLVHRPADDRLSYGRSRSTDEVGQVVLFGSLGSHPEAPAARTPAL